MTVGIGAITQENGNPKVVLAADRMITTGQNPQIEYEHTRSKIKKVFDNDVVTSMAVASGTVSFIESFFNTLDEKISDQDPHSVDEIADYSKEAYTEVGKETVENQVLSKFELEISDLTDGETGFDSDILSSFLTDVADAQERFSAQLEVLLVGIDGLGPHIYSIQNFDLNPHNTIGYHAVGSGSRPARSVFIRNQYDTKSSVEIGIINTIEAKRQSEEAKGVGSDMDLAVVNMPTSSGSACEKFSKGKKDDWADLVDDIEDAEKDAREDVIRDKSLEYTYEVAHEAN